MSQSGKTGGKAEKWAARGERLSAALRANLKRRKEQARSREKEREKAAEATPPPSGTHDGESGRKAGNK